MRSGAPSTWSFPVSEHPGVDFHPSLMGCPLPTASQCARVILGIPALLSAKAVMRLVRRSYRRNTLLNANIYFGMERGISEGQVTQSNESSCPP